MNKVLVAILSAVFGLFFLAFGVYGVAMEYRGAAVHTSRLIGFLFLVLLGASIFPGIGGVIFSRLKDGVGLAGPYLPTFGRRASQGEVMIEPPREDKKP